MVKRMMRVCSSSWKHALRGSMYSTDLQNWWVQHQHAQWSDSAHERNNDCSTGKGKFVSCERVHEMLTRDQSRRQGLERIKPCQRISSWHPSWHSEDIAPVAQHSTRNDSTLDTYPTTVQAVRSFVQTDSSCDVTADAEYAHADVMILEQRNEQEGREEGKKQQEEWRHKKSKGGNQDKAGQRGNDPKSYSASGKRRLPTRKSGALNAQVGERIIGSCPQQLFSRWRNLWRSVRRCQCGMLKHQRQ